MACLTSHTLPTSYPILYQLKKKGGLRGLGPPCGVERRENFPAILLILLNPLHSQKSSVGQCSIMLQDDLSLPLTCHTQNNEASGVSEGNK